MVEARVWSNLIELGMYTQIFLYCKPNFREVWICLASNEPNIRPKSGKTKLRTLPNTKTFVYQNQTPKKFQTLNQQTSFDPTLIYITSRGLPAIWSRIPWENSRQLRTMDFLYTHLTTWDLGEKCLMAAHLEGYSARYKN